MLAVNGNYIVRTKATEQKNGAIFVATDSTSQYLKCEIVCEPKDGSGIKVEEDENYKVKYLFTFKDKIKQVSIDGESLSIVNAKDVFALSN